MILIGNIWAGLNSGGSVNITLTTDGTGGASTLIGTTLNVPIYQAQIVFSTIGVSGASTFDGTNLNIPVYQGQIILTTDGDSGPATFDGTTLNIPDYSTMVIPLTLDNGLTLTGTNGQLGGPLIQNTVITGDSFSLEIDGNTGSHISEAVFLMNITDLELLSYNGASKRIGFILNSSLAGPFTVYDEANAIGPVGAADYSSNIPGLGQIRIDPLQYIQRSAVNYKVNPGQAIQAPLSGTQNFASYNVPAGNGQFLRVNVNCYADSVGLGDTISVQVVYTDRGGVARVNTIATYTVTGDAQAVPSVTIIASGGTSVNCRIAASVTSNYHAAGNIEYIADFT